MRTDQRPLDASRFSGLFFTGLSTLLFEVSLIRVLSFTIWHHFAYVIISTALLGYGAAGSVLTLYPAFGRDDPSRALSRLALASGVTAALALGLIAALRLDPMRIFDTPGHAILFIAYQLIAAVPFFFSGLVVSLAFCTTPEKVDRLYFFDLLGAGSGCAVAVFLMNTLSPPGATLMSAAGFAAASALFADRRRQRAVSAAVAAALATASMFGTAIPFSPAESKHLFVKHKEWVSSLSRWTALFRTDVIEDRGLGPALTDDDEWGLSRAAPPGVQRFVSVINHDGSAGTPLYDLRQGRLDFLDYHILRVPYLIINERPHVLVIGVGAGRDVVTALRFGAAHVTGAELDPATVDLVKNEMSNVLGGLFQRSDVTLLADEGRHLVRRTSQRFDLIQLTGVDTLAAAFTGAYVLAENYLYTVEAFHDYLDRLTPGGILSFATGDLNAANPKATGRMVSVARQALLERGKTHPEEHVVVIDSGRFLSEILIRESGFNAQDRAILLARAKELQFIPRLLPGSEGTSPYPSLVSADEQVHQRELARLRYDLRPTTDNRPFFFAFYRWSDLINDDYLGPAHTEALGQIVLALLAVSLALLGVLFVLAPLVRLQKSRKVPRRVAWRILGYFLSIGLGFMFFEISLLQRFVLFLGHPTYSLSVTLASLLISLGVGSLLSRRWIGRERAGLAYGILALAGLALFYSFGLAPIQMPLLDSPLALRCALSVLLLCPLGFVAGHFFPLGILVAARTDPALVPWAWAINACASVSATVLAVILAMAYGFQFVWVVSVAIYAAGALALAPLFGDAKPSADQAP